ncbi:MAG TPA: hypothetical protein VF625_10630, partial [Longimicrobium sp.]
MILLFDGKSQLLERCLASTDLPARKAVSDWGEMERAAPAALCSVILIERLHDEEERARLLRFQRRFPWHPVVLATGGTMDNARHLHHLAVEQVVWLSELADTLPAAVRWACGCGALHSFAASVAGARHLPRTLRDALVHACDTPKPVYSVAELASTVHCDRTTLCLQWRKAIGPAAPLRLVDFLGLVLLLHANRRKQGGGKTLNIAAELGVHEHTLRRLFQRHLGRSVDRSLDEEQRKLTALLGGFINEHLLRS